MNHINSPAPVHIGFLPRLLDAQGEPLPVRVTIRGGKRVILAFTSMAAALAAQGREGGKA